MFHLTIGLLRVGASHVLRFARRVLVERFLSKEKSDGNIVTFSFQDFGPLVTPERLADINHSNDAALQIEAVKRRGKRAVAACISTIP